MNDKRIATSEDDDPDMTQVPMPPTTTRTTTTTPKSVIDNISSMQEGLRLKQQLCENNDFVTGEAAKMSSMSNLLVKSVDFGAKNEDKKHFYFSDVKKFIEEKQHQQKSEEDESEFDVSFATNAFSTPVRASFRNRKKDMR